MSPIVQKNAFMEHQKCFTFACALRPYSFILLLLLLSSSASLSASQSIVESSTDRLALLSFESLLSYTSQALSSWRNTSLHFCQWRGVNCSDLGGESRVTALDLHSLNLTGKLSPSLANLTFLRTLNLNQNNLRGPIPRDLASLSNLAHLDLSGNMLEGEIPGDLGSLSKLETLSLSNKYLTGSIPQEIWNLSSIKVLVISFTGLSGGIPAAIGNLSSLTYLDLNSNKFTGPIPPSIGNLARLEYLDLHINLLNGSIPSEIGKLASLGSLFLGANQLTGSIPKTLGSLKNLTGLILSYNRLEAGNAAEWGFVDALTNCTRLVLLILTRNALGGVLPESIANLSKTLQFLSLDNNQIAGSIPAEIGNLLNLTEMNLSSNLLSGAIPASLGNIRGLVQMDLSRNRFAGQIPATLGNLTSLTHLILSYNELNGSIPASLGNCSLITLQLESNKLTGTVPKEIISISSLSIIFNVSHNSLTGSLPSQVGSLKNIQTIDVSNNRLSGKIPDSIAACEVLQDLHMQGNIFEGSIPSTFSQLRGLVVLDVSSNNLSGNIPDFLRRFHNMTYLNISYNNFDGELPKDGVFSNATTFSVVGNSKLCGGITELYLPPCSAQTSKKKHLAISVAGGIFCLIVLISFLAALYLLRKSRRYSALNPSSCIKEQPRKVSFDELQRATDGFSLANLFGVGSFGSVYKGMMDWEDHKVVAVKVFNLQEKGALKSFMAECEALRNIRHRNLVKILTSCSSVDFRGNEFRALVFEFIPNGSLDEWLHPKVDEQGKLRMLSLIQRLNISIDVASALAYLHHHGTTPIIHCDLKPNNVLLDHDMVARVGDFGLARFLAATANTSTMERSMSSSINLKGTIGYAAPEYGMTNKVSAQGDVYSYGILILEMFTGKRPTDDTFSEGLNLHKYVEMALQERVAETIDPKLFLEVEGGVDLSTNESRMRAIECITSMLRIGILCSKESPKERMNMEDVKRELHNIKDAFIGCTVAGLNL
ncbi:putative LRR receptor-like serine/threonine-protein kinase [Canna indica]|uniref:Receptor kinase-like protein Xa21 n=1 Tax=Canna indica TaxID=4628 RepID=A0AAQ3Q0D0_9LILI|nr:putative LRR receptor-like serine/threonine-protein kinase [Canna indica]